MPFFSLTFGIFCFSNDISFLIFYTKETLIRNGTNHLVLNVLLNGIAAVFAIYLLQLLIYVKTFLIVRVTS